MENLRRLGGAHIYWPSKLLIGTMNKWFAFATSVRALQWLPSHSINTATILKCKTCKCQSTWWTAWNWNWEREHQLRWGLLSDTSCPIVYHDIFRPMRISAWVMMSDICHLNFKNIGHICPANFNNTITCTVIYKFPCGLVVFSRAIPVYIHTHAVDETFLRGYESHPHFLIFSPLLRGLR